MFNIYYIYIYIYVLNFYFWIAAADAAAERSPTEFDSEPFSGILTLKNDFILLKNMFYEKSSFSCKNTIRLLLKYVLENLHKKLCRTAFLCCKLIVPC